MNLKHTIKAFLKMQHIEFRFLYRKKVTSKTKELAKTQSSPLQDKKYPTCEILIKQQSIKCTEFRLSDLTKNAWPTESYILFWRG